VRPFLSTPVPEVELRNAGEHLVSVHAKLHGEPLSDLSGLKEKEQQLLAVDLATFLTELHSIPTAHWALGPVAQDGSEWRELLAQCEAQVFPLIPAERATELRQQFGEFLAIWEFLPCRIIHGDFGTGNILIDQDRLTGVIDFSGCGPGDPAYDFASLAAGFGDAFTDLVLNHFPEQEGMRTRIEFYRSTFPLLDILHGIENDDKEALRAGLMGVAGQWDE
jgi:aminoglycoside 2''-phosphotransferase